LEIIKWVESKRKHNNGKLIRIASKASNTVMVDAQFERRMKQLWASSFLDGMPSGHGPSITIG
jgi:hypothetical protein